MEKLKDILYFENEGKKQILENINKLLEEIQEKTNIKKIILQESTTGYYINYTITEHHQIFCYTLTEVIIHLRYMKNGGRLY